MGIVECVNVKKSYRQDHLAISALNGITITIVKGSFVAIAGPSGSGKTTLLNLIGGLDKADSGHISVDGNIVSTMNQLDLALLRLQKIGFVFQSYNLIPVLSASENVEYVMLLQGVNRRERRERAVSILDEVGLQGMYNRRPSELSGGQQQRVAVARAIVSNPSIVLADEPTANLDSKTGKELLELMKKMNEEKNVTFIFSTHDKMVMDFARRLITLRDGLVSEEQTQEH
jgi:putative ABC transport system ATP-binding protein